MMTFGLPTSTGRWGFQDQGRCTSLPARGWVGAYHRAYRHLSSFVVFLSSWNCALDVLSTLYYIFAALDVHSFNLSFFATCRFSLELLEVLGDVVLLRAQLRVPLLPAGPLCAMMAAVGIVAIAIRRRMHVTNIISMNVISISTITATISYYHHYHYHA